MSIIILAAVKFMHNHPRCRKFITIPAAAKFAAILAAIKVHFHLCCIDVNNHLNCGKAPHAVVKVMTIPHAINHHCLSCRIEASYVQRSQLQMTTAALSISSCVWVCPSLYFLSVSMVATLMSIIILAAVKFMHNHPRCRKFITILAAAKFAAILAAIKVHFPLCCFHVNNHLNCGKAPHAVVKVMTIPHAISHHCVSCRIEASYVQRSQLQMTTATLSISSCVWVCPSLYFLSVSMVGVFQISPPYWRALLALHHAF